MAGRQRGRSLDSCCIQGWTGILGGVRSFGQDPLLDAELRLSRASPCIDRGRDDAVHPDVLDLDSNGNRAEPTPLDFAGQPRFVDSLGSPGGGLRQSDIVDIGAYELD